MWSHLPLDILAYIFSFLPRDSLARAKAVSKHWHTCGGAPPLVTALSEDHRRQPPWFAAFPARKHGLMINCYVHSPSVDKWYVIPLDFLPGPVRPISTVGGLVLCRSSSSTAFQLGVFNPFERLYRQLPMLNVNRISPAVGIVTLSPTTSPIGPHSQTSCFRVYVAGGMSTTPHGSVAMYEPTLEMYDSENDTWQVVGPMPMEFAVRLTVWTQNESVHINGLLYWITSARAYSIMGFDIASKKWVEMGAPMADRLDFASLVGKNERLTLVGGTFDDGACIWELEEGQNWNLIGNVPTNLGRKFVGKMGNWSGTKCVGVDGFIWLYKELRSGMLLWRESNIDKGRWGWVWVDGYSSIKGRVIPNMSIRGLLLHPNLSM